MAKIEDVTRIIAEDYPKEFRDVVDKLGYTLNSFMTQIVDAFNKNINFDNLNQEIKEYKVTVGANGIPIQNNRIATLLKAKGIIVIKAQNLTNPTQYPINTPFINYTDPGTGVLLVNHISGLQANEKYKLTIILIG